MNTEETAFFISITQRDWESLLARRVKEFIRRELLRPECDYCCDNFECGWMGDLPHIEQSDVAVKILCPQCSHRVFINTSMGAAEATCDE